MTVVASSSTERPRGRGRQRVLALGKVLLVLAGLATVLLGLAIYRQKQFEGYGLKAVYFANREFKGTVFRTGVESIIDFTDVKDAHFKRRDFSVEWKGTIVLPRAGRYGFAVESDDGAWVDLDNRNVLNNGGIHEKSRREVVEVLTAGPHAIRIRYFQATLGASIRLFWEPAGRRGGFEPIPPTLLFPAAPDRVDPRRAFAIPPRDLPCVVLGSLAILLAGLLLGRRPLLACLRSFSGTAGRLRRQGLLLFAGVFAVALAVRLYDLSGAGQTWDEDVYFSSGRTYLTNLLALDLRPSSFSSNFEHPAVAKWLYGPATLIADDFDPARAVAAVVSALTCAFLFLAGSDLVSRRVGLLGGLLAAVMPHLIAHGKVIGLEAPTGLFYMLSVWIFFRAMRRGEQNTGLHLAAFLFAGLAISTRILNFSVLFPLVALYLASNWRTIVDERRFPVPITLGLAPTIIVLTFFGLWPYLWGETAAHLGETLTHWKPDPNLEFFLGKQQESHWYYFPTYFAVTMPAPALFLGGLGIAAIALRPTFGHVGLLLWLLAPFAVMLSPLARDGVRYLYPALFPACLLTAAGVDSLAGIVSRLVRRSGARLPVLGSLGAALFLYVLARSLAIHPYYLDYYSEIVGGTGNVAKQRLFEFGWWGEGLEEATRYLNRRAPKGATVKVWANPRHVLHLRPDLVWNDSLGADYILYNELFNGPAKAPGFRPAYTVRAGGGSLAVVFERDP